jgi:hypothetical protein
LGGQARRRHVRGRKALADDQRDQPVLNKSFALTNSSDKNQAAIAP